MNIYTYDPETKEYLSFQEADKDPEESKIQGRFIPLVPAYATLIEPPDYDKENQIPVFDSDGWVIKSDYRKNYKKCNDDLIVSTISNIGEIEDGFYLVTNETAELIEQNPEKFKVENNEVVQKSDEEYKLQQIQKAKEAKISEINTKKEAAFKDGIIFNGNHFDCDDRAQDRTGNRLLLLQAMPVESLEWLDFNYKPVEMTAQEFQQLCAAIFERIQFIEFKTGLLLDSVEQAETIEDLENIVITFEDEQ